MSSSSRPPPPSQSAPAPIAPDNPRDAYPILNPVAELVIMERRLPSLGSDKERYTQMLLLLVRWASLMNGLTTPTKPEKKKEFEDDLKKINDIIDALATEEPPSAELPSVTTQLGDLDAPWAKIQFHGMKTSPEFVVPAVQTLDGLEKGRAIVDSRNFYGAFLRLTPKLGVITRIAAKWGLYNRDTKLALSTVADSAEDIRREIADAEPEER